ncbi:helix-hairpin-helix domain-containing protein [Adhaeribacter sp. BT258]|uniref:Helix-hairpin-helix domain-containing protein n=1 Tax=Adhaeribacter terrigena TaxID=2793070 RepID=A0ABS1C7G9_9BACT|nr:helix-hairpin-helix domain-containing protein [Adhaeribacter terrigena]MBK0404540.1 helix-hairpin-helix domain-containing protein [Adhaeribacter terrigena]
MNKLRFRIRQYFGFSQRETSGFLVLLALMAVFLILPLFLRPKPETYDPTHDQQVLDSLAAVLDAREVVRRSTFYAKKPTVSLKPFNPNQLTEQQWIDFGMKPWLAKRILNYRQKVGDFKSKADVQKIYGLPDSVYQKFAPYILLPETAENARDFAAKTAGTYENRKFESAKKPFRLQAFDINLADTTELKRIRGIGSKLSVRILKYRDRLGGFTSEEQIQEVFGLQPETVDSLRKYTYVENDYSPKKINLNTVTFEELKSHPYLKFNQSRAIIAYRDQHGPYQKIEDLRKIKLMDEATFAKLRPYLAL